MGEYATMSSDGTTLILSIGKQFTAFSTPENCFRAFGLYKPALKGE